MATKEEYPPAYSSHSHDPATLVFPPVATGDLSAPSRREETIPRTTLEPMVMSPNPAPPKLRTSIEAHHQQYVLSPREQIFPAVPTTPIGEGSEMDVRSDVSVSNASIIDDRSNRAVSVLSMDDLIAAQALHNLGTGEQKTSRCHGMGIMLKLNAKDTRQRTQSEDTERQAAIERNEPAPPEPLLSLLTSSHPLIGTAINGSLSAYSSSKSYSPRFRTGAEFVERRLTPVANTMGTVGRRTGVEGGVRWWLGGSRRPSTHQRRDSLEDNGTNKRRKVSGPQSNGMDIEQNSQPHAAQMTEPSHRRTSQSSFAESLPAYDDHRSPGYEEHEQTGSGALVTTQQDERQETQPSTWHSRLMLSTSGLGVAMSEESLRSLKYCLSWLRWANVHLGKVIVALKNVVEEWEQWQQSRPGSDGYRNAIMEDGEGRSRDASQALVQNSSRDPAALFARIQELKGDVLKTLKSVVDVVSRYAGGALPENARDLVRRHLTSLPQRFRLASSSSNGTPSDSLQPASEAISSAHRVLVLAKEGLDMMSQVSGVLDGTLVSAEEWCERLGRRKRGEPESPSRGDPPYTGDIKERPESMQRDGDVEMRNGEKTG
ncbi:Opi1-domain-containing protein [Xylona heveae TC161]|uniref:Opi1-domain-containing protein n=1 Tax=Xylona heveae (strain CBS 132557 / TC161) TaxID=1328760 RepID=A0A165AFH8_XYLHT|nr:Opi1-domain-containing protein [Xylona heveae TC161]KZF20392.1 Opi1-domain-containing protein [Xylona heveae TC161]